MKQMYENEEYIKLFTAQEKSQQDVNLYNTLAAQGNALNLQNFLLIMGGDPRPKLSELDALINKILKQEEANVVSIQSQISGNKAIVNNKKAQLEKMRSTVLENEHNFKAKEVESQMLQMKIDKSKQIHILKIKECDSTLKVNTDMIESMNLKQRSFVLQKALIIKDDSIIDLILDKEVDPNFRNGEGVSLMQTANEVKHQLVIDKLLPYADPLAHLPPVVESFQGGINVQAVQSIDGIIGQMANLELPNEEFKDNDVEYLGKVEEDQI